MPTTLYVFIGLFLIGILLRSRAVLVRTHADGLATIVFSVSLPATIIVSFDRVTLEPAFWKLPIAAGFVVFPLLLATWVLARHLQLPRPTRGSLIVATGIMNMAFFAYPVLLATFGEEGFARVLLFDLGHGILVFTVIYGVAVRHGSRVGAPALARFFSSVPLWAVCGMLGVKLAGVSLPTLVHDLLTPIHLTTLPLASLVLGLSLDVQAVSRHLRLALLGTLLRMGGGFLLGCLAASVLQLTGLAQIIVMLSAAMPAGLNAVIFARQAQLDYEVAASIVALSIAIGIVLLPLLPQIAASLTNAR